jgi:hypothetical protein
MASKRNQRRKQCRDKHKYMGENDPEALRAVEEMSRRLRSEFEIYHCAHCGAYHIGHSGGANSIANVAKIEFGFNKGARRIRAR